MNQALIFMMMTIWLFPFTIFMFYRIFLENKKGLMSMYILSIILVILGLIMVILYKTPMFLCMLGPLFFFSLYDIATRIFVARYNRKPIDTGYNWQSGIFADRVYNITVTTLGLILPILIFALLYDLFK
ncbi:hypothetical protein [Cellulophaga sp. L1A9]|uniref:hypothetical protein n=1 Tax=Cellulophaga sp. L1A9 TaxID=2686362 RepID=UPI00131E7A17|nr:hypothetical protein [Cellulophaga sp. L1A9]